VLDVPRPEAIQGPPKGRSSPPRHKPGSGGIPVTAPPDIDLQVRHGKAAIKARRRGLHRVSLGLAFHYPGLATYWAANVTAGVGLTLHVLAKHPKLAESLAEPARSWLTVSSVAILLTWLFELPPTVFGMFAPGGGRRILLVAALALRSVACLFAGLALAGASSDRHVTFNLMAMMAMTGAWVLWMGFLHGLGGSLGRPEVAAGARETCVRGLRALACSWVLWSIGAAVSLALVRFPPIMQFVPGAAIAAAARVGYHFGGFESLFEFFLYPTGLPFALAYVQFIGGLRGVIARRA
jgi:hypothetical protein